MKKFLPYDITQEHNIKLVFNMTKPMKYPIEHMAIQFDMVSSLYYFNEDNGIYKPSLVRNPPQFALGAEPQPPPLNSPHSGHGYGGEPLHDQFRPDMETERDILNSWGGDYRESWL